MYALDEIKDIARRYILGEPEKGKVNMEVWGEVCAPDMAVVDTPGIPEVRGFDNMMKICNKIRAAIKDVKVDIHEMIAEEDKVVAHWSGNITTSKTLNMFGNIEIPEGTTVYRSGITILRFRNGKIIEETTYEDRLGLMEQLGIK